MGRRRKARELALQSLYALEDREQDPAQVLDEQSLRRSSSAESRAYAAQLVNWVREDAASLDASIAARLEHWDLDRLSLVLRLVLRMSLAEGRRAPEVPSRVLYDEAVELARKYDGDEGAAFVNGVLEVLLKDERGEAPA